MQHNDQTREEIIFGELLAQIDSSADENMDIGDFSQDVIMDQLLKYIEAKHALAGEGEDDIENNPLYEYLKKNEKAGFCFALSFLFLYCLWLKKQDIEDEANQINYGWFWQVIKTLVQWDGNINHLNDHDQLNIELFAHLIDIIQNPHVYTNRPNIWQSELLKTFKLLKSFFATFGKQLQQAYTLCGLFTIDDLGKKQYRKEFLFKNHIGHDHFHYSPDDHSGGELHSLLHLILKENRLGIIGSGEHVIGIFFDGTQFTLYDTNFKNPPLPTSPLPLFTVKADETEKLAKCIFECFEYSKRTIHLFSEMPSTNECFDYYLESYLFVRNSGEEGTLFYCNEVGMLAEINIEDKVLLRTKLRDLFTVDGSLERELSDEELSDLITNNGGQRLPHVKASLVSFRVFSFEDELELYPHQELFLRNYHPRFAPILSVAIMIGCIPSYKFHLGIARSPESAMELTDEDGESWLHFAVRYCPNFDLMKEIILDGIDLEMENEKTGETALYLAVKLGNIEKVYLLLSFGANINTINSKDQTSLLDIAIVNQNRKMIAILIECGINESLIRRVFQSTQNEKIFHFLNCCLYKKSLSAQSQSQFRYLLPQTPNTPPASGTFGTNAETMITPTLDHVNESTDVNALSAEIELERTQLMRDDSEDEKEVETKKDNTGKNDLLSPIDLSYLQRRFTVWGQENFPILEDGTNEIQQKNQPKWNKN